VDALTERWQFHQIVLGNSLHGLAGLAPGGQPTDDHERVEAFFPQQVRHPGAGRFARSSTVQINVLVFRKVLDFLIEIIWLDPDGVFYASS
jgi:hypothetical protein